MTLNSPFRVAAVAGVAASLFSFAHVTPVAAQAPTRIVKTCSVQLEPGEVNGGCTVTVPAGKRFIIENASVGGTHPSSQWIRVSIYTMFAGASFEHVVPAGFQILSGTNTKWSGAMPGTMFSDPGNVQLHFGRGNDHEGRPWMRMTVSGYLEDIGTGLLR